MRLLAVILTLFLSMPAAAKYIEPDLAEYVARFIIDLDYHFTPEDFKKNATVVFKELEWSTKGEGPIGYCTRWWGTPEVLIEIDPNYWARSGDLDRWQLMYHELGHCACDLEHSQTPGMLWLLKLLEKFHVEHVRHYQFADGCPKSIMHPYNASIACVAAHKEDYLEELRRRCKTKNRFRQNSL